MNATELDILALPSRTAPNNILYFRFMPHIGHAIQQVEYDMLQTNLSQHRGYDDSASDLCRNGYWAVAATSETGMGEDALEYTECYLRSMPVVDAFSISPEPPLPIPS